jgi:hypothetical protein
MGKVFGVGLSRTGTTSLTVALNILGYNVLHGPNDDVTRDQLMRGQYRLKVLETHDGITDIPVAVLYPHMDRIYPGSKFILTVRDENSWIDSMRSHCERRPPDNEWRRFIRATAYGCVDFSEERLRYVYRKHESDVLDYFGDRPNFMVMNVCGGNGWNRLCRFLDKPVPDSPFPHENSRPRAVKVM